MFLGQTEKPAERVINADPDAWYRSGPSTWAAGPRDLRAAVHDPATVHAMCCDYRAGLRGDRAAEDADGAAGRRITCPTLFCWSTRDDMVELYGDPLAIWRDWADDVTGMPIESGHHMAEENPEALTAALRACCGGDAWRDPRRYATLGGSVRRCAIGEGIESSAASPGRTGVRAAPRSPARRPPAPRRRLGSGIR